MLPAAICTRCTAKHHPPHRDGRLPKIGRMCTGCAAVVSRNFSDTAGDAHYRHWENAPERETRPARPARGHSTCVRAGCSYSGRNRSDTLCAQHLPGMQNVEIIEDSQPNWSFDHHFAKKKIM